MQHSECLRNTLINNQKQNRYVHATALHVTQTAILTVMVFECIPITNNVCVANSFETRKKLVQEKSCL